MRTSSPKPLFIGMPVYNGERWVARALDSILGQSFGDFELMISDNASTDASEDICRAYEARDSRITFVKQPTNMQSRDHFLFLLRQARAPYFMWAACDDEWHPEFVSRMVATHEAQPDVVLTFCPYRLTHEDGTPFGALRAPDYAGDSAAVRIARLCKQWDDGVFYGVFKRYALDGLEFPVWWGRNGQIPLSVAYPPLCYVLAKGNYALVGDEPMWFNRQHGSKPYIETLFANAVLESGAYVIRQLNLEVECVRQVYRATGSTVVAAEVVPPIAARVGFDVSWRLAYGVFATGRSILRKAVRSNHDGRLQRNARPENR